MSQGTEVGFRSGDLLGLNHRIRETEHALAVARRRKRWSNLSLFLGPLLAVVLYAIPWLPAVPRAVVIAAYIPAIPVVLAFCATAYYLKRRPGYPHRGPEGQREFTAEGDLELSLARLRDERKLLVASVDTPSKVRRVTYKEDAYADIETFRTDSRRYRNVNNMLQGVLIVGSLAATGVAGISGQVQELRWVTLGLTFAVGISSGFMGYFKYKERSFYLQQTADAIESEWEAIEIGVGRYKKCETEDEALADFVEEVHRLKSEQKKRQQNLEQPPEVRDSNE
jgi:hypothetical protein